MTRASQFLIIGGGPAGAATALTLARAGLSVTLIEQSHYQTPRVGELFSPEGQESLLELFPDGFNQHFLTQIGIVGAWDDSALSRFAKRDWWTLDRLNFDRAVAREAEAAGAQVLEGRKVKSVRRLGEHWLCQTTEGEFHGHWLIDATGRSSQFSRAQGAQIQKFDRQIALVAFLEGEVKAPPDMLLETSQDGWWYAAPIDDQRAVAVYITDSDFDKGEAGATWSAKFQATQHVKARFGNLHTATTPRRVAAGLSLLVPGYGDLWCSVGEAFAAFDPLSNLGVGRSIGMGHDLGKVFIQSAKTGAPPDLLSFYEQVGAEFRSHSDRLAQEYRNVHRFTDSKFWYRRTSTSPHESSLRVRSQPGAPRKLLFPAGQLFECTQCGKCCGGSWVARVDLHLREALETLSPTPKRGFTPLRILDDGRLATNIDEQRGSCVFLNAQTTACSLHGTPVKPDSCSQFPFLLRETPDGVEVGVSHLCRSIQENTGQPLEHYRSHLEDILSRRAPNVIPQTVSISWGKGLKWESYRELEDFLLSGPSVSSQVRALRWYLTDWLHQESLPQPLLKGPTPQEWLLDMEAHMASHLVAVVEGHGVLNESVLSDLLRGEEMSFPRLRYVTNGEQMRACLHNSDYNRLEHRTNEFLIALVRRKFLLLNIPLLHNLVLLAALPQALHTYTVLSACKRGVESFQDSDFHAALDIAESRITAYARHDKLAKSFVEWHLDLYRQLAAGPSQI